ncbi:MAG: phage adsorption protein NrfB [Defluviitaleaceae bacterium]|nr:phage adsorption protein NrfB [Defluviitaleaceae bacterium]
MYYFALASLILLILLMYDDVFFDWFSIFYRLIFNKNKFTYKNFYKDIASKPPKLLAFVIGAWREDDVLEEVVTNLIRSQIYLRSMYHIFLGVYPNDPPTLAVANRLAQRFDNVHVVINCKNGGTSKAQNINWVISQIKEYEKTTGWRFCGITIHDSEDVVSPYELLFTSYLYDTQKALQFPVYPLVPFPRFKNFFSHLTTNTYADEFAENHFYTMSSRFILKGFVPSAGTGFAVRRDVLDSFDDELLPSNSLTEDYRLSLTMFERGIQFMYVLLKLPFIRGKTKQKRATHAYIATRSMFPNSYKAAVRQKTRWICGITLQSVKFTDIFQRNKNINLISRYLIYKDMKGYFANLASFLPFLLFTLIALGNFVEFIPRLYIEDGDILHILFFIAVALGVHKQTMRAIGLWKFYGARSIFFSLLFPPIVPIRFVYGIIINTHATIRAIKQFFTPKPKETPAEREQREHEQQREQKERKEQILTSYPVGTEEKSLAEKKELVQNIDEFAAKQQELKELAWDKTDHTFLPENVLKRFHAMYGVLLVLQGHTTEEDLSKVLEKKPDDQLIGSYLLEKKFIKYRTHLHVMAMLKNILYIEFEDFSEFNLPQFAKKFDRFFLEAMIAVPILLDGSKYIFLINDSSPNDAQTMLRQYYKIDMRVVFDSRNVILGLIKKMYTTKSRNLPCIAMQFFYENKITYEQLLLVKNWSYKTKKDELSIMHEMGLVQRSDVDFREYTA